MRFELLKRSLAVPLRSATVKIRASAKGFTLQIKDRRGFAEVTPEKDEGVSWESEVDLATFASLLEVLPLPPALSKEEEGVRVEVGRFRALLYEVPPTPVPCSAPILFPTKLLTQDVRKGLKTLDRLGCDGFTIAPIGEALGFVGVGSHGVIGVYAIPASRNLLPAVTIHREEARFVESFLDLAPSVVGLGTAEEPLQGRGAKERVLGLTWTSGGYRFLVALKGIGVAPEVLEVVKDLGERLMGRNPHMVLNKPKLPKGDLLAIRSTPHALHVRTEDGQEVSLPAISPLPWTGEVRVRGGAVRRALEPFRGRVRLEVLPSHLFVSSAEEERGKGLGVAVPLVKTAKEVVCA